MGNEGRNDSEEKRGQGRPRIEDDLRPLITKHHGCMKAMGKELGISRQAVKDRLEVRGLTKFAELERAKHGTYGVRLGVLPKERERIIRALARHDTIAAAADALRIHRNRLQRRIAKLEIRDDEIEAARLVATAA